MKGKTMGAPLTAINQSEVQGRTSDWEADALCRNQNTPTDVFFSEDIGEIAHAKRICAECPVLAACLEGAIARQEPYGVWGGQLFLHGRMIAQKRRRGRPRKVARPEDQLPVVPIPVHLRHHAELQSA